jgi:lipopolysaccharide/colanic/teichoic acid biosynthesis glycosyltransferase
MSLVGPRPELEKYTQLYTPKQQVVLSVRPGMTDYASIEYIHENDILGNAPDWEKSYIEEVMPAKIALNMRYIENRSLSEYFRIIWLTLARITGPR